MVERARGIVQDDKHHCQQITDNNSNQGLPPCQPQRNERAAGKICRDVRVGQPAESEHCDIMF